MNQQQIAGRYLQGSAQGAHPVGLVARLYDAVVEDLRRALESLREGDVERRTRALNHALLIIAELESVLDYERGGQVARHLSGFYRVTRAMIVDANVRASGAEIERLIGLFLPVRQAWQQAERDLAAGNAPTARAPYAAEGEGAEGSAAGSRWNV
ncbi:MAG: flagellar export chaperone FliS [Candidatus Acidiferrales bacterium]|jgi:flagellar protein FliS